MAEYIDLVGPGLSNSGSSTSIVEQENKEPMSPDQENESVFSYSDIDNLRVMHKNEENTDDDDDLPLSKVYNKKYIK